MEKVEASLLTLPSHTFGTFSLPTSTYEPLSKLIRTQGLTHRHPPDHCHPLGQHKNRISPHHHQTPPHIPPHSPLPSHPQEQLVLGRPNLHKPILPPRTLIPSPPHGNNLLQSHIRLRLLRSRPLLRLTHTLGLDSSGKCRWKWEV